MVEVSDPDPVVQALNVAAKIIRDWPPDVGAVEEWDSSRYLPGGDRYIPKLTTYGTPVCPTSFIRFDDPEVLREEAAAEVLAVFRELGVLGEPRPPSRRVRRLPRLLAGGARQAAQLSAPLRRSPGRAGPREHRDQLAGVSGLTTASSSPMVTSVRNCRPADSL